MTSTDGDYGQTSNNTTNNSTNMTSGNQHNNNNNYNRRINSNSTNPCSSSTGIEIRILMTSRDAGAVIGMNVLLNNRSKNEFLFDYSR